MIRERLKNINNNKNIQLFLQKYKVPKEFFATTRKIIIRGVAIGLFIAMIPMPFQMVAILVFIPLLRFNVPIALVMCWVTNPLTMPFIYYIEYITGGFFLHTQIQNVQISLEWFQNNLGNILFPLYLGALFYSTIIAWFSYYLLTYLWKRSVYKAKNNN